MRVLMILSFMLSMLIGCADSYHIEMTGYGGQNSYKNKTYDFSLSSDVKTDLEAMGYIDMLEKQLKCINWVRVTKEPDFILSPSFGTTGGKKKTEPKASFGGSIGMFGGNIGSGLSLGTFLGTSIDPQHTRAYTKFLDIKMFARGKTEESPLWQGKIFSKDDDKTLAEVMPVLIKFAVENFGQSTDGDKEFTYDATKEEIKALEKCSEVKDSLTAE